MNGVGMTYGSGRSRRSTSFLFCFVVVFYRPTDINVIYLSNCARGRARAQGIQKGNTNKAKRNHIKWQINHTTD